MTDEELLKTPLKDLDRNGISLAIAAKDRKIQAIAEKNKNHRSSFSAGVHLISDDLGTKGVLNPATGKTHDSRSAYYRELKEHGHIIHEPGMDRKREQKGNYVTTKEVVEAAKKTGLWDKLDNKKQREAILTGKE